MNQSVSDQATKPMLGADLASQARSELLQALPHASEAVQASGTWQPLMATLSEASRVPVPVLIPALTTQCAAAKAGGVQ